MLASLFPSHLLDTETNDLIYEGIATLFLPCICRLFCETNDLIYEGIATPGELYRSPVPLPCLKQTT